MFSQLWRRLTGGRESSDTTSTPAPGAPAGGAAPAAVAPTDAGPAALPENSPRAAEAAAEPGADATAALLQHAMNWRARVLLDGAATEIRGTDAAELVEVLRSANDTVIRQVPLAAQRALAVARNPDAEVAEVTRLFEKDPTLAQGLLRAANSIYYRRDGAPCTSLHTGVQRVGMKGVQGVLMMSMVQQMLCRPGGAFEPLVQKVWSHMQRTAPIARTIAPAFGFDPETAYSLALLHDVGKLIVFDHISTLRHDHRREVRLPDAFFRQLLWHLHEPLGGLAVLRWNLGSEAAHAVADHHRRQPPPRPDPATECLFVAEHVELAHTNFTKLDWDEMWREGALTADAVDVQERLRDAQE